MDIDKVRRKGEGKGKGKGKGQHQYRQDYDSSPSIGSAAEIRAMAIGRDKYFRERFWAALVEVMESFIAGPLSRQLRSKRVATASAATASTASSKARSPHRPVQTAAAEPLSLPHFDCIHFADFCLLFVEFCHPRIAMTGTEATLGRDYALFWVPFVEGVLLRPQHRDALRAAAGEIASSKEAAARQALPPQPSPSSSLGWSSSSSSSSSPSSSLNIPSRSLPVVRKQVDEACAQLARTVVESASNLTVNDLKRTLTHFGLRRSGNKKILQRRLQAFFHGIIGTTESDFESLAKGSSIEAVTLRAQFAVVVTSFKVELYAGVRYRKAKNAPTEGIARTIWIAT